MDFSSAQGPLLSLRDPCEINHEPKMEWRIEIQHPPGVDATNYRRLCKEQPADLGVRFPSGHSYFIQRFLLTDNSEFYKRLLDGDDADLKFHLLVDDEVAFKLVLEYLQYGLVRCSKDLLSRVFRMLRNLQLDIDLGDTEHSEFPPPPVCLMVGDSFFESNSSEESSEESSEKSSESAMVESNDGNQFASQTTKPPAKNDKSSPTRDNHEEKVVKVPVKPVLKELKRMIEKSKRPAVNMKTGKSLAKKPVKGISSMTNDAPPASKEASSSSNNQPMESIYPRRDRKRYRSIFYHGANGDDQFNV